MSTFFFKGKVSFERMNQKTKGPENPGPSIHGAGGRLALQASNTVHITGGLTLHNHCSGDTRPSDEDLSLTTRLCDAGRILGIELHDHIIIADGSGYRSLKKDGII